MEANQKAPEAVLYLDGKMRKDCNIYLTDCLLCPAFIWQYENMFRYTQLDWVVNVFSVIKRLIKSLRIFPSRYNTASGYLKIILQILKSLSVSNCYFHCIGYLNWQTFWKWLLPNTDHLIQVGYYVTGCTW
jgi:hypothetical protein